MSQARRWTFATNDPLPAGASDAIALLGGKGASLRRLAELGYRVPFGFTISTAACRAYFEAGRRWPAGLFDEVKESVERMERELGSPFGQPPNPLLLAVRSGAACSMPGMLATLLNVGLNCSQAAASDDDSLKHSAALKSAEPVPQDRWERLRAAISFVFDSWRHPHAVHFRAKRGIEDEAGTAVTVQTMHRVDVAGVMFTRDPRGRGRERLLIEAVRGSGKQLVEGTVTPERYELDRRSPVATCGPESLLSQVQIAELAHVGLALEGHWGQPLDIEWGYGSGELVLFQARPLAEDAKAGDADEIEAIRLALVRRLARRAHAAKTRIWVRHNLGETLSSPTPLTWDLVRRWMCGDGGFGRLYRQLGYRPSRRVRRRGFLDLIAGRIYADPDRAAELFRGGLPLRYDLDGLRRDPSLIDRAPSRLDPDHTDALFLLRLPVIVARSLTISRRLRRGLLHAAERFDRQFAPRYVEYIEGERRIDLGALTSAELIARLEDRARLVLEDFAAELHLPGLFAALAYVELEKQLALCLGADEGGRLARELLAETESAAGESQPAMLARVAADETTIDDFLRRYGHRGPAEMELASPRWRDAPREALQAARRLASTSNGKPRRSPECIQKELRERMLAVGAGSLHPRCEKQLALARRLLPYRELGRDYFLMGYDLLRQAIAELGRRFDLVGDVYWLRWKELIRLPERGPPPLALLAKRRWRAAIEGKLLLTEIIEAGELDRLGLAPLRAPTAGDEINPQLIGTPLSNGVARGAVSIEGEANFDDLPSAGGILVFQTLDPAAAPIWMRAAGLIVERGGVLSHGAILARQLGIPVVVVPGAARLLRVGEEVLVDGDRGIVVRERGAP